MSFYQVGYPLLPCSTHVAFTPFPSCSMMYFSFSFRHWSYAFSLFTLIQTLDPLPLFILSLVSSSLRSLTQTYRRIQSHLQFYRPSRKGGTATDRVRMREFIYLGNIYNVNHVDNTQIYLLTDLINMILSVNILFPNIKILARSTVCTVSNIEHG